MSAFTPAQQSAIAARGNVLVVAGAGTGKTRTLIERCLQLLREGASLDQMLLVTFTEAAAAEMRVRLRKALQEELQILPPLRPSRPCDETGFGTAEAGQPQRNAEATDSELRTPNSKLRTSRDALAEQLALLDTAQISTLHSFCLRLVREHFHHLAIDPQLVILDERQTRPLARDTLTALLTEHYAGRHPHSDAVQQLIRRAGRGSDEHLRVLVWKLHCYAQSLPDPDAWFTAQLAAFCKPAPTQWKNWLHEALVDWRSEWLPALANVPDVPALKVTAAALAKPSALREPHSTLAVILIADDMEHWKDSHTKKGRKGELRPAFEQLFKDAAFFHSLLGEDGSATALAEDWEWCRHEMAALVRLSQQFTTRFGEAKRQLGGVDFADLEQFALRLLRDDATGVARACRAQFAHVCVDEYQDINAAQDAILRLVSGEGADANRFLVGDLKQSIYRFRLANPHIFAGYAKAWRGGAPASGPALPSGPYHRAGSETGAPEVIALSENFRSREAILTFVNPLFRALMRGSVGGVDYDAEAELKFGNPEGRAVLRTSGSTRVELHVLTKDADETSDDRDATTDLLDLLAIEREARCVALRLHELHARGHEVWDEETHAARPVEWRDMVVLMRSPGSRVESFAQEFHRAGVPLQAARGGFYEALEVSDLLNLLRLLDNPLQDLPLLAVLRSPLVAMSLEELVALRAHNEERLFWDALTKFCAAGQPAAQTDKAALLPHPGPLPLGEGEATSTVCSPNTSGYESATALTRPTSKTAASALTLPTIPPLPAGEGRGEGGRSLEPTPGSTPAAHSAFEKASAFLTRFATWRDRLRLSSLTDCVECVLAETHYESLLLAESRGAERVANVRRLLDLARQFDPYQRQGLHRFLQFIAAQEEAELDHEPAPAPTDNAVRLMSIHQSKGLEFPVVVVAGLGTLFNERDLRGDILLDEEFGLCPMVSPPGRERRYASLPHWLARRRGRRELLGEELRLLYVALTRARDTLLLVGTDAGKDVAEKWRGPAEPLADAALLKARCPLNWLRAWLPSVTRESDWHSEVAGQNELLSWDFYAADDERLASNSRREETPSQIQGEDGASSRRLLPEEVARLRAKLDWCYRHSDATHEPAKTSVTVLRRRAAEADEEATPWFRSRAGETRRKRGELSAAQLGVAHHTFLQGVDLARAATELDLRNEAARLVATGFLTERDAAGLDFAALLRFWESPVGQAVRTEAKAGRVQREVPFTARFTVAELREMGLMSGGGRRVAAPSFQSATANRQSSIEQNLRTSAASGEEEFLIVQGVADLVVFREQELWLLDYKTDHFPEAELPAKLREYGPQLSLYELALERIHRKRVTNTWLHFLALGRTEQP
jgi:ATP-dependent helicase/nuclease subunit A